MFCYRKLYWTDWGLGTIEKASYDGSDREVVVTVDGEPWLNGLALDLIGRYAVNRIRVLFH